MATKNTVLEVQSGRIGHAGQESGAKARPDCPASEERPEAEAARPEKEATNG